MLSPDTRSVAVDLLRPPPGYRFDTAVITTYSLDLEALLALPLATLQRVDDGIEELLEDPLALVEPLREAAERIRVFVDEGGIAIPRSARSLYALLEDSVHPVRAPHGGAFHPKVWVARFLDGADQPSLRVAVLSRNLTFDRSWDVALTSEGAPRGAGRRGPTRGLGKLLRALPGLATEPLSNAAAAAMDTLTSDIERTLFPAPEGAGDSIVFHVTGIGPKPRRWRPLEAGGRTLAIAPFANRTALNHLADVTSGPRQLVSRQDTLDALPAEVLAHWESVQVMAGAAEGEPEDESSHHLRGLHAKLIVVEQGWEVTWLTGSANLTAAAFEGRNVEMMAELKGRRAGARGMGIERFMEAGFRGLCSPYQRTEAVTEDEAERHAREQLAAMRDALLRNETLKVICGGDGETWSWTLAGEVAVSDGIEVHAWPVSLSADRARLLELPLTWNLPVERLSSFVAFRLHAPEARVDDIALTLKLPAEGIPEHRLAYVLRSLIDSPEKLLRFLRALLGGLDSLVIVDETTNPGLAASPWHIGSGGDTLLEDLMRVASRDPERLERLRSIINGLRETESGPPLVPDDLYTIWEAVDTVVRERGTS